MSQRIQKPLWWEIADIFGLVFCPVRHSDGLKPVKRTTTAKPARTSSKKPDSVKTLIDGKDYLRTEQVDENGTLFVIDYDSSVVTKQTDRVPELTKYDKIVFEQYKAQDKYQYFTLDHYEIIKKYAWSQFKAGKPIGYKSAGKITVIENLEACGERRRADYYKAMYEAHNLSLENN